jgi:hypothetical protein
VLSHKVALGIRNLCISGHRLDNKLALNKRPFDSVLDVASCFAHTGVARRFGYLLQGHAVGLKLVNPSALGLHHECNSLM